MVLVKCDLCKKEIHTVKTNLTGIPIHAAASVSFTNGINYYVDKESEDYCLCNDCAKELHEYIKSKLHD